MMRLTPLQPRKPKRAVALQYDGVGAPRLTAKGCAETAERILALAEEHGVPIYEDPGLAAALAHLDLGDEVPELLYLAIAEVLAFVYDLDTLKKKTGGEEKNQ
ncbi:EscU/YscU/HrcU family type III secretion system export apparatus switch protein [Marinospirillum alkaliphilum]|uniref:Flagellar biosynthetic protein FlhB n=1 Tax=Marinospirillum alkaliphilum DSM 21637 TaxID=1122209 RepID=A0A1K1VC25_9GAMM|nr:EscU/YscU/HrcU family type III secretion system export apparatus switch protein [Marinospirillum alkaliphilum]SFX22682.1 flagellar biosynthesis protein [Marinospirillum alkaliphilum DSM 21637]